MAKEILVLDGTVTQEQYRKAASKAVINLPVTVICILVGICAIYSAVAEFITFKTLSTTGIFMIIISALLIGTVPYIPKMHAKALTRQTAEIYKIKEGEPFPIKVMFYKDKLVTLNGNSAVDIPYKEIKRIYKTSDAAAIKTRRNLLLVLPREGYIGGSFESAMKLING